jgi:hypothetical protein
MKWRGAEVVYVIVRNVEWALFRKRRELGWMAVHDEVMK